MDRMNILLRVVRRELGAVASSRLMLLLSVVLPLFAMALFTVMFRQSVPENLPVAVCDLDRTGLSRSITRMVEATPAMGVVPVDDLAEGRRAVLAGKAYGLLVLPEHMEREVLAGRAPVSRFYINNQIMLPAGVIKRAMMKVYGSVSAGVKLGVSRGQGVPDVRARERAAGIHIASRTLFNPNLDYRWYLHAAICPFLLKIFIMCATVWSVGGEIKRGRVSMWLDTAQGRVHLALLGKLAPLTLWFTLLTWAMLALIFGVMEMPVPDKMGALMGGSFLFVVACQAVALSLVAFTGELTKAVSLTSFYAGSAFVFAGVTFPSSAMPLAARIWHNLLPLSYMVQLMNEQALKRLAPIESLGALGALLAIALVCGGVAWVKLSGKVGSIYSELSAGGGVV
ncbi:hypothetical protein DSLASN_45970 [Desulfoluna limicola]|uniref:ABC-2 type transporter transmembrane domain-containing protein n=1 Tax=Desulfoluna limicola TaxID=2810562 RepID=A0ABM7PN57_9BACT|nr:ABC transporter permease [Desulfoluna limicola]BCS98965.1 hypothetical protein DSLASN_45970 [Desulfoluna limicola]